MELTEDRIDPACFRSIQIPSDCGAVAEFSGVVRGEEKGSPISALFYEIYPVMTHNELKRVVAATQEAHAVTEIRLVHRHGRIAVGETALWIQVLAPHRAEAFAALEFCIRRLKETVPIWKVEREPG